MKRSTLRFRRHGILFLTCYVVVAIALWAFQDRLVYPGAFADRPGYVDITAIDARIGQASVVGAAGNIHALYVEPRSGRPIVIAFHGNAMYPEDFFWLAQKLASMGTGLVAPAFRGYPRSGGRPSEPGIHADAKTVYDWVRERYPSSPIHVLGHSLGSGVALRLASEEKVEGIYLLAPYLSISSVAWKRLPFIPVPWLLASPYPTDLVMGGIRQPVLAWHGKSDAVVPIASGRALMELAPAGSRFFELDRPGHGDIVSDLTVIDAVADALAVGNP